MKWCSNGRLSRNGCLHLLANPKRIIGSPHHRSFITIQSSTRFQSHLPGRKHVFVLQKRAIFSDVPPFILVPGVFVGLLIGHWLHKCLLMVLFQNKIIYMPSLPPGSRRERLEEYSRSCGSVSWEERQIKSLDGTKIALAIARPDERPEVSHDKRKKAVILYFQGNGASIPPRTPMLSRILRTVSHDSPVDWTLVALSYRGFWTSRGRAHQKGIEKDAEAFINWTLDEYGKGVEHVDLILWGQSIGAGVASYAASRYLERNGVIHNDEQLRPRISRLILETPFVSIRSMLAAIYPDKWVPYKHLWPFLRSWWDSEEALSKIAKSNHPPKVLLVIAARDEIVPRVQSDQLEKLCKDLQLDVTRQDVLGALHTQASTIERGKQVISAYLREDKLE